MGAVAENKLIKAEYIKAPPLGVIDARERDFPYSCVLTQLERVAEFNCQRPLQRQKNHWRFLSRQPFDTL
jgi:hypothetical protein